MHLAQAQPIHYLPVATTALSLAFLLVLLNRYRVRRSGPHLLWWAAGIAAYGLGTALESAITLNGNTIALTKAWYIAGALLGGYPLAQGTVYLLLQRRTAHVLSAVTVPFIIGASVLVVLSPVSADALEAHRPSGAILSWQWVRLLTPFINLYAVVFLVGGAIYSAARYALRGDAMNRAIGNSLIAIGAVLPGVGGAMAKADLVEGLYVGEFIGLLLIWAGYAACVHEPRPARAADDTGIAPVRVAQDKP
jgi:hypothetical protein